MIQLLPALFIDSRYKNAFDLPDSRLKVHYKTTGVCRNSNSRTMAEIKSRDLKISVHEENNLNKVILGG